MNNTTTESPKNPHAVALGRRGGQAGTGPAKSHPDQLKAWWASPAGQAEREKRRAARCQVRQT